MDAKQLQRVLTERGFVVLAVTADHLDPGRFVVYLHAVDVPAEARPVMRYLRRLPWVAEVTMSVQSPAILLVRRRPGSCG